MLEVDGTSITFVNQSAEHQIKVPAGVTEVKEILHWQKSEIDRILRQNQDIDLVAIKTSEYARSDTKSTRLASYFLDPPLASFIGAPSVNHKPIYVLWDFSSFRRF